MIKLSKMNLNILASSNEKYHKGMFALYIFEYLNTYATT